MSGTNLFSDRKEHQTLVTAAQCSKSKVGLGHGRIRATNRSLLSVSPPTDKK